MTIRTLFVILAILAVPHGIAFVLFPFQLNAIYGLEHSSSAELVSRLFGAVLVGIGSIIWLARDFREDEAVRAVLMSSAVSYAIGLVVVVLATLAGTMNAMGWFATLIYLFGTVGCGYFLITHPKSSRV
jgi:hypothetical protein